MEIYNLHTNDILLSILRWILGLLIGCVLGLFLALLGNLKPTKFVFIIISDFFRAIPILGLVPVIQMNIGVNEYGKIGLIAWSVMFPVWITVRMALDKKMQNVELVLMAATIKDYTYFKLFTLPKLLGGFLRGVEIAIGIGWLALVASEWIGTYTQGFWAGGLGYELLAGYELNNWETVHVSILLFGALGLVSAYSWRLIMYVVFIRSKKFNPIIKEIISN